MQQIVGARPTSVFRPSHVSTDVFLYTTQPPPVRTCCWSPWSGPVSAETLVPPRPSSSASASLADREAARPLLVARSHSSALPPPAPAVLLEQEPFASLDFGDEGAAGGGAGECEASGFCRTAVPGSFT